MVGTDATMASNVHLYKHVGFDPVKDFAPVALCGRQHHLPRGECAASDQVRSPT